MATTDTGTGFLIDQGLIRTRFHVRALEVELEMIITEGARQHAPMCEHNPLTAGTITNMWAQGPSRHFAAERLRNVAPKVTFETNLGAPGGKAGRFTDVHRILRIDVWGSPGVTKIWDE